MHSHDRTMLARLGFADPDKGDRRHDLACQYLARPEGVARLVEIVLVPALGDGPIDGRYWRGTQQSTITPGTARHEVALSKGRDQYKTTIGFLDVMVPVGVITKSEGHCLCDITKRVYIHKGTQEEIGDEQYEVRRGETGFRSFDWAFENRTVKGWRKDNRNQSQSVAIVVEVKVSPVGVGDMIRQINLYKEHFGEFREPHRPIGYEGQWAVATYFPLKATDADTLIREGIRPIRLGDAFDRWCDEQHDTSEHRAPEI